MPKKIICSADRRGSLCCSCGCGCNKDSTATVAKKEFLQPIATATEPRLENLHLSWLCIILSRQEMTCQPVDLRALANLLMANLQILHL